MVLSPDQQGYISNMSNAGHPSWLTLATEIVAEELPSDALNERTTQLLTALKNDFVPIVKLVEALGPHLTSTNDVLRARAVSVLAEVRTFFSVCVKGYAVVQLADRNHRLPGTTARCRSRQVLQRRRATRAQCTT